MPKRRGLYKEVGSVMDCSNDSFETVDIEEFYDKDELNDEFSTNLVVLTDKERALVNLMFDKLKTISPETLEVFANRMADLERLTRNIAHFPSLFQQQRFSAEVRNENTLVESLLAQRGGDRLLHLPTKAILGKGFLVAKFQAFTSMTKIAAECRFSKDEIMAFQMASINLMFTLMAEDVYLSLLDNTSIPVDIRQQVAYSLTVLWEHRSDQNVADMAPVLESVWAARRKLAPVFGTMVGTSELLLLSIEMDDQWCKFISSKLGEPEVAMSMEEFLFGLSYEDIQRLKQILRDKGINAIGRDEVASFLNKEPEKEQPNANNDPRQFYLHYSVRRDNAKARSRMKLPGPHYTLEDHYMRFILEKNKEKQYNDVYAKQTGPVSVR